MNIEFHYYTLYYLARNAGFSEDDSLTIAISSQLVDECQTPWEILSEKGSKPTEVTQNYLFWNEGVAKEIYRPFHFLPGERDLAALRRKDGKPGLWPVTQDSPLARDILIAALKSRSLFRMGIALHAYADTWAHQNFSADEESANSLGRGGLPPVGHLQALGNPDDLRGSWTDPRLKDEFGAVANIERCTSAVRKIYRFLKTYQHSDFIDEDLVLGKLLELWKGKKTRDQAAWASDYIIDLDVPPYLPESWPLEAGGRFSGMLGRLTTNPGSGYDQSTWLTRTVAKAESAFGAPRGSIEGEKYSGSQFARWNLVAQDHRRLCLALFSQRGIA